jgi:two-component system chemotaxis response regulator CheB
MSPGPLVAQVEAVVIGASAGGIEALSTLLPAVRADVRAPILIVVHLPRERDSLLPKIFAARCALLVKEAEDKEPLANGTVYFAPADYHLQVEADLDAVPCVSLSCDDPVNWSRPSIDVLFSSAADVFGPRLLAILLTGAIRMARPGWRRCGGRAASRWWRIPPPRSFPPCPARRCAWARPTSSSASRA